MKNKSTALREREEIHRLLVLLFSKIAVWLPQMGDNKMEVISLGIGSAYVKHLNIHQKEYVEWLEHFPEKWETCPHGHILESNWAMHLPPPYQVPKEWLQAGIISDISRGTNIFMSSIAWERFWACDFFPPCPAQRGNQKEEYPKHQLDPGYTIGLCDVGFCLLGLNIRFMS